MEEELLREMEEAKKKAIDALSRYKFQMFGYWAAIWVHLNRVGGFRHPNPFAHFVKEAKRIRKAIPLTDRRHPWS